MPIPMLKYFPWNDILNMAEIYKQRKLAIEQHSFIL